MVDLYARLGTQVAVAREIGVTKQYVHQLLAEARRLGIATERVAPTPEAAWATYTATDGNVRAAAARLGCSPRTLRSLVQPLREAERERRADDAVALLAARSKALVEELRGLCQRLGYVPTTHELQRDHCALAGRLGRQCGYALAPLLRTIAKEAGLPRRWAQLGVRTSGRRATQ